MKNILLTILLLTVLSCQRDDDSSMPFCEILPKTPCEQKASFIPYQDTCFAYNFPDPGNLIWNLVSDLDYYLPILNPTNAEELVYFKADTIHPINRFKGLDFCSGDITEIYQNLPISGLGRPNWGVHDWLVFTNADDHQVWKIKSNGDSLQQVTAFPNIVYIPKWINGGTHILGATKLESDPIGRLYVFTPQGEIVDTITASISFYSYWDGKLATTWELSGERLIGYYDLDTKELHPAPAVTLQDIAYHIDWLDEDNIMFSESKVGLQRVNIQTGEVTMLVEECDNRRIRDAATSPIHEGIIYFTEIHNLILDSALYHNQSRIYKLDAFTGEQWLVDLEE